MERGGFEPPAFLLPDLQSGPFNRSGTSPKVLRKLYKFVRLDKDIQCLLYPCGFGYSSLIVQDAGFEPALDTF